MKNILVVLLMLVGHQAAGSVNDSSQLVLQEGLPEVVKTLLDVKRKIRLEVTDGTYIRNIQGYACAWPAIDIPKWKLGRHMMLQHAMGGGFMVTGLGLAVRNPNMRYCSPNGPKEVFGIDLVVGEVLEIELHILREIVSVQMFNAEKKLHVRETISSELGTERIYSSALLAIE